jgi:hypothetical protein
VSNANERLIEELRPFGVDYELLKKGNGYHIYMALDAVKAWQTSPDPDFRKMCRELIYELRRAMKLHYHRDVQIAKEFVDLGRALGGNF